MIEIGCNYIIDDNYDNLYKFLVKRNFLNVLKFPGKLCNYNEFEKCLNLARNLNIKIDLHGLPKMEPRTHSENMLKNVEWSKLPEDLSALINKKRFSTHIGAEMGQNIEDVTNTFINNIKVFKENFYKKYNEDIKFGGENQSGRYNLPLNEISPSTISKVWDVLDFGVFDVSHAKLASMDLGINYKEYINKLENKDKVKILHISGNVDKTVKFKDRIDKHLIMDISEINDIIYAMNQFTNLDLIITEYAFNSKYSFKKELIIELCTLNKIVKTLREKESIQVYNFLSKNLKDDISNLEEVLR